jgi:hypothetical protein
VSIGRSRKLAGVLRRPTTLRLREIVLGKTRSAVSTSMPHRKTIPALGTVATPSRPVVVREGAVHAWKHATISYGEARHGFRTGKHVTGLHGAISCPARELRPESQWASWQDCSKTKSNQLYNLTKKSFPVPPARENGS